MGTLEQDTALNVRGQLASLPDPVRLLSPALPADRGFQGLGDLRILKFRQLLTRWVDGSVHSFNKCLWKVHAGTVRGMGNTLVLYPIESLVLQNS